MLQPFVAIYRFLRALAREAKTLVMVGPRILIYRLVRSRDEWQRELPVQRATALPAAHPELYGNAEELVSWLSPSGAPVREGFDSVYLSPKAWAASPLAPLASRYPADSGLKLSKTSGDLDTSYAVTIPGRRSQSNFGYPHQRQGLLYAFLHLKGIAPRIFDTVRLSDQENQVRVGYVVEHIEGGVPDPAAFEGVIRRIKELRDDDVLHLTSAGGWRGVDFLPPDANGNVIQQISDRATYYVDVHNFILGNYGSHLEALARKVSANSHFGNRSVILGGSGGGYLYQEIPGVRLPAKRSPRTRMREFDRLVAEAGISLVDKAVLDIGCNLGLMGDECLRRGARWLHGWDMPHVVDAARQVLLSIGCTRFSLTPAMLHAEIDLAADLPDHLKELPAEDVVLGYFAIRGHVNWLPGLTALPWRWMLYEGHQGDRSLDEELEGLAALMPIRVLARGSVADFNSFRRDVAVVERLPTDR